MSAEVVKLIIYHMGFYEYHFRRKRPNYRQPLCRC